MHGVDEAWGEGCGFVFGEVEDEFVVDLEEHACLEVFLGEELVDADHGEFDHFGGGALDGEVDGGAFGVVADGLVVGEEVWGLAAAAAEGADVALLASVLDGAFHGFADGGVFAEVGLDDVVGFFDGDVEALGEAEGRDAVDDAEVDHFGGAAHV